MFASRPSRTAEIACLMRAAERLRPPESRVLDDPFAELLERVSRDVREARPVG